jgi:[1-hydroxy-2-(trimethylamino)ethyl]phosphonate dioxygenase
MLVETIFELFDRAGAAAYFGESVSQREHALQTAHLAATAAAADDLIVAALLHDLGHLLHGLPESIAEQGVDGRHEVGGSAWLAGHFGPGVTEPIRLHVAAKRYLCAVDPAYAAGLSAASRRSLELQGGPFSATEVREFSAQPYAEAAVRLRRWDDQAKVPGLVVPALEHYQSLLVRVARQREKDSDAATL